MKREIIHITEDGRIVIPAVHPDKIRMDEAELIGLFNIVAPTLRAAKRRIYKLGDIATIHRRTTYSVTRGVSGSL